MYAYIYISTIQKHKFLMTHECHIYMALFAMTVTIALRMLTAKGHGSI